MKYIEVAFLREGFITTQFEGVNSLQYDITKRYTFQNPGLEVTIDNIVVVECSRGLQLAIVLDANAPKRFQGKLANIVAIVDLEGYKVLAKVREERERKLRMLKAKLDAEAYTTALRRLAEKDPEAKALLEELMPKGENIALEELKSVFGELSSGPQA